MSVNQRHETVARHLGRAIRDARRAASLSQREVAKILGISPNHLALVERGRRLGSLPIVLDCHRHFGLSFETLMGAGTEEDADAWAEEALATLRRLPADRRVLARAVLRAVTDTPLNPRASRRRK